MIWITFQSTQRDSNIQLKQFYSYSESSVHFLKSVHLLMFCKWGLLLAVISHQSVKYCFKVPSFKTKVKSNTLFFRVHLRSDSGAFLKLWHAHFSFSKNCDDGEESSYCAKETCDSQMLLFRTQTARKPPHTSIWSSLGKATSNQHFINIMSIIYHPRMLHSSLLTWHFKLAVPANIWQSQLASADVRQLQIFLIE